MSPGTGVAEPGGTIEAISLVPPPSDSLLLSGATLADGSVVDIEIGDGMIAAVHPHGARVGLRAREHDLRGWLLLPSLVEPHAHLDKTGTGDVVPNITGDLAGAIAGWVGYRARLRAGDVLSRARTALRRSMLAGVTALRSHVDTGDDVSLTAVADLLTLRTEIRGVVTLQVVAGYGLPATGPRGSGAKARAEQAIAMGADALGGAPSLDENPYAALDVIAGLAAERNVPLDLHIDETLNPQVFLLPRVAAVAEQLDVRVTVGHAVSLAGQPAGVRRATAEALAAAGIAVVTLPQSNLYLQGRGDDPTRPRGLTALDDLAAAGVVVAGGSDNVADPFNPMGRGDPLETASLLVTAGHLAVSDALAAVTDRARIAIGLDPVRIAPGHPADLVAVRASSAPDALGRAPTERLVFRAGRPIANTVVHENCCI